MLGGVGEAISKLGNGGCTGETITEDEFINSIYSNLMENGYTLDKIKSLDVCKYFELIAYKADKKDEQRISNLLF